MWACPCCSIFATCSDQEQFKTVYPEQVNRPWKMTTMLLCAIRYTVEYPWGHLTKWKSLRHNTIDNIHCELKKYLITVIINIDHIYIRETRGWSANSRLVELYLVQWISIREVAAVRCESAFALQESRENLPAHASKGHVRPDSTICLMRLY